MMDSERILTKFCSRLHSDESDPVGSISIINQIGNNQLQLDIAGKPLVLTAVDEITIKGPRTEFHVHDRTLTDEMYEQLLAFLHSEIPDMSPESTAG